MGYILEPRVILHDDRSSPVFPGPIIFRGFLLLASFRGFSQPSRPLNLDWLDCSRYAWALQDKLLSRMFLIVCCGWYFGNFFKVLGTKWFERFWVTFLHVWRFLQLWKVSEVFGFVEILRFRCYCFYERWLFYLNSCYSRYRREND